MKSKTLGAVLVGVGGLIALAWWWPSRLPPIAEFRERTHSPSAPAPGSGPGRESLTIHEIRLDKRAVCRGEENFVNVRASGPDGSDAHLRISLKGSEGVGPRLPFRLYSNRSADLPTVLVEGRAGAKIGAPLPPVEVRDCEVDRIAAIEMNTVGINTDDWSFSGSITSGAFEPQSYEWDFGDGTRSTSANADVTHSYRFRRQDKRYASFLVTLTMRSGSDEILQTTRVVSMSNAAYGRLVRHHEVALFAQHLEGADGELTRLYHAYNTPVLLERVSLKVIAGERGSEVPAGTYSPATMIGIRQLLPSQPEDVQLALQNLQLPETRPLTLLFEVNGVTTDGLPANGEFSAHLL